MKIIISIFSILTLIVVSCSKENDTTNTPVVLSDQNIITSFSLTINNEIISGIIDENGKTITFNVVGADLNSLMPIIQYSENASLSPLENEAQDFNNEVIYNVFAENGDSNAYRVIVNNRPLGTENKILSFSVILNNEAIEATIDHDAQLITFSAGSYDKTALSPSITVSEYASISPQSNLEQNFDNSVIYTVTAEDGNTVEYKVLANAPTIVTLSTLGGTFTSNPILLYIRADIRISGQFIDPDRPGAELYLSDGTNNYPIPILDGNVSGSSEYITFYNLYSKIPDNIPTGNNYKIIYKVDDIITESESYVDIVAENAPRPLSLNQDSYNVNDVLIITGENLTDMIAIPSNGSVFLIENSNNYDLTVNPERTEITLTLDYYYLFPSYFGNGPEEKVITLLGSGRRAGETITTIFN